MKNNNPPLPTISDEFEMCDAAEDAFANGQVLNVAGPPGSGKTDTVQQAINLLNDRLLAAGTLKEPMRVIYKNHTSALPEGVCGFTMPHEDGINSRFLRPPELPFASDGDKHVVLLLDERDKYDETVKGSLLSLVNPVKCPDGIKRPRLGGHVLSANTHIIATCNRVSDASGGTREGNASLTRNANYEFLPRADVFCRIMRENTDLINGKPLATSAGIMFVDFESRNDKNLISDPVPNPPTGESYNTPRTLHNACRSCVRLEDQPERLAKALSATLGHKRGEQMFAFVSLVKDLLPKLGKIRETGDYKLSEDPQERYALLHCAVRVALKEITPDKHEDMTEKEIKDARLTAVAGGGIDWLIDMALAQDKELCTFLGNFAEQVGVPISQHAQGPEVKGANNTDKKS